MNNTLWYAFVGDDYYPLGGWRDLIGSYSTLDEAQQAAEALNDSERWWAHIVHQGVVVCSAYDETGWRDGAWWEPEPK